MTRLELVSSGVIDLYDDIPMSLNLSIVDIEQPDKRTMTYSKTITLPGTSNNNNLFKHVYEIDSYSNYNPYVKAKVIMYEDEVNIFEGYLKLNNIITNESKIEYEVVLFADTSNFYLDMGDALLSDLDMSAYNHTYNETNIVNSWSAPVGSGYVYPCIFYGEYEVRNRWNTQMFYPAVYVKTYLDKIFSQTGYTYSSPFFNSDYFKRLIIPYTGGDLKLTDTEIQSRLFEGVESTRKTYDFLKDENYYTLSYNTEPLDPSNQFGGIYFKAQSSGYYTFNVTYTYRVLYYLPNYFYGNTNLIITKYDGSYSQIGMVKAEHYNGEGWKNINYTTQSIFLNAGELVFTRAYTPPTSTNYLAMQLQIEAGIKFKNSVVNTSVVEGDTMTMSKAIPRNIKQKDFVMSLIKMFNLFVDIDRSNNKKLIIEPRDDFYSSGTIVNWDAKVDYSKPIEIKPTTDNINKKYIYAYKPDRDYLNELYFTRYQESFGTQNYFLDYDFLKGEKKVDVIFSPTPLIYVESVDRYYSSITPENPSISSTKKQEFNIRILYYGGLKSSTRSLAYKASTYPTYPYAGHLDDPKTPYKDLSFGVPREVYHNPVNYTNQNLFNFFHKRAIDEITNKFTRIVTAYIYLNPTDIVNLNFRNIYYFGGHYMRLLNIVDYSPNKSLFCKCEFLKIKDKDIPHSSTFTTSQPTFYGGVKATF